MSSLYSTKHINKQRLKLDKQKPVWLFGYGSIIFKVDFAYIKSSRAYLSGWQRRFWMASQDHRGTPTAPGRVLTLEPSPRARCFGMAYQIEHDVLEALDHREQNGYLRHHKNIELESGEQVNALVYLGDPESPVYKEEHDLSKLAEHICKSKGPSGENKDYVYELAQALRMHGENDSYVFELEQNLKILDASDEYH